MTLKDNYILQKERDSLAREVGILANLKSMVEAKEAIESQTKKALESLNNTQGRVDVLLTEIGGLQATYGQLQRDYEALNRRILKERSDIEGKRAEQSRQLSVLAQERESIRVDKLATDERKKELDKFEKEIRGRETAVDRLLKEKDKV